MILFLLSSAAYAVGLGSLSAGDLVISEIMADPQMVADNRGQWFEIRNDSGVSVDLSGLVVTGTGAESFTVAGSVVVPAGGYAVLAARDNATVNGQIPSVSYRYLTTSFSLSTASDTVTLKFGGVTFDSVSYDNGATFPDPAGASMGTSEDAPGNDAGGRWCAASSAYGLGDLGTPGSANDPCLATLADLDAGDLLVSEVMIRPALVAASAGEWFEVYNASPDAVDLLGLEVYDAGSDGFTVGASIVLQPGEYAVFAVEDDPALNGGLPVVDYEYDYALDMAQDDSDTIELAYGVTVFDTLFWGTGDFPIISGMAITLSSLSLDAADNDDGNNWCVTSDAYGDGDYGSPGTTNDECVPDSDADGHNDLVDCEPFDDQAYPGAPEDCDGIDSDCDGDESDASDAVLYYEDGDGDGYGDAASSVLACSLPGGYAGNDDDCDDGDAGVNPGAGEACDGTDDNCSGSESDASDAVTYYADADYDLYGDPGAAVQACSRPSGYRVNSLDCDDTNAAVKGAGTWYGDGDGDGYGDASDAQAACAAPGGYLADKTDCNDNNGAVYPGATESCDGVDSDCDGSLNDSDGMDTSTWYADADRDLYGNPAIPFVGCTRPSGYRVNNLDCNDANAAVKPNAAETCNGTDNNCSGSENDASDVTTYYADGDGDAYGDAGSTLAACSLPGGYAGNDDDCDDGDAGVSPAAVDVCNDGIDNDCDGHEYGTCDMSLADADVRLYGVAMEERAGGSLSAAGDVDGDGTGDLLIGAQDPTGAQRGAAYLVLGGPGLSGAIDLDAADAALEGADGDNAGLNVAGGYDLDGDGFDDLVLSAVGMDDAGAAAGGAYVVYGPVAGQLDLADDADVRLTGAAAGDEAGKMVASPGDLDGDGWGDLAISATEADLSALNAGAVYLYYGGAASGSLSGADAILQGHAAQDRAGYGLAGPGDLDGDGLSDLLVNAYRADPVVEGNTLGNAGITYLITEAPSGAVDILDASAATFLGEQALDQSGSVISGAGDLDGDGHLDVAIGAQHRDPGGLTDAGVVYLVSGPFSGEHLLSDATATLIGEAAGDYAGRSITSAGDIDGDGLGDLLVGAKRSDANGVDSGAAYLLYGPLSGSIPLSSADILYTGASAGNEAGISVALLGDVDDGGSADLAIGACKNGRNAFESGAAYVIFGERW